MRLKSILSIFTESAHSFEGQHQDENVVLLLRKHVFTIYLRLLLYALAMLIPIFLWPVIKEYLVDGGFVLLFFFIVSFWYLLLWVAIFFTLTMYSLNIVVITNRRIIESEQNGFFNRKISELHTNRVQDVSIRVNGFIQTLLRFGDISVQTASAEKHFLFEQIPNPDKVKDEIMRLVYVDKTRNDLVV